LVAATLFVFATPGAAQEVVPTFSIENPITHESTASSRFGPRSIRRAVSRFRLSGKRLKESGVSIKNASLGS